MEESVPAAVADAFARADVSALQSLSTAGDKLVSKAAKRALHRLRARGVPIPELAAPGSAPSVLSAEASAEVAPAAATPLESREPVWATTIDGSGDRALFVPLKAPRGFELHLIVLSDERGVLSLTSRQLSRRQLHLFMTELTPETRELLREISFARARALLAAAIALDAGGREAAGARELLRSLPLTEQPASAGHREFPEDAGPAELAQSPTLRPALGVRPPSSRPLRFAATSLRRSSCWRLGKSSKR